MRCSLPIRTVALLGLCAVRVLAQAPATPAGPDTSGATASAWVQRVQAHVGEARERTLVACAARGVDLPADFLAWVDADPVRQASVYGCRKDPLVVLLQLRALELDLGVDVVRSTHPQLALAFALDASYRAPRTTASPWNDGDTEARTDALPDVVPRDPLAIVVPGDPRVPVDTKATDRALDRDDHIVNFLEDHAPIEVEVETRELPPLEYDEKGVAKPRGKPQVQKRKVQRMLYAADVIASAALQDEFNAYMRDHGHPDVRIECGDRVVHWHSKDAVADAEQRKRIATAHELFQSAYRAKGRMPAERDRAPTAAESMAWFLRNDRHEFSPAERAERKWPRFPLTAPWPVLMMLAADDQPLREREDIWVRFRDHGEMRTYGEYIGGIAQQFDMQSARRSSPLAFSYGSIQMMWKDGGVCGTMGNIGARTYRICGIPASTAGQPGHCAVVRMDHDPATGRFRCVGDQYATGGDEVTTVHAQWNYDDVGGRKPMVFHQSVAWAVNHDFPAFVDTLVMRRAFDRMDAAQQRAECLAFLEAGLARNPFSAAVAEAAIAAANDQATLLAMADRIAARLDALPDPAAHALLKTTLRDLAHARIRSLPAPADADGAKKLLGELERQGCRDAVLLARCWRAVGGEPQFAAQCRKLVAAHLALPPAQRNKQAGERLRQLLQGLGKTVTPVEARRTWAREMLAAFAGRETITARKKEVLDPAVEWLRSQAEPAQGRSRG
ncbi:MAG: hypothetical protein RL148_323 [Planctomycetota bacterium]